jgi:hypothetical protein
MAITTEGTGANNAESNTATIVVRLIQGNRVWVQHAATTGVMAADIWGTIHTYFNGALLYTI